MLFKLAIKNIKKSIKDYSIYFFTLVVAVAIFYSFNSLDSQSAMMALNSSSADVMKSLVQIISYISIFVSVILCFLIVYSNNFLIKRRKKEFGLYLTLGMSKEKVSYILVLETLLVGLVSLAVGLVIGVILSQILSILTAKIFEFDMSSLKFAFSSSAFIKTIIYFGIIFVLVMLFNIINISKNKLIDLLTADKKNEKIKVRNPYLITCAFILSISLLYYAYHLLFAGTLFMMSNKTLLMLIFGALGTYLFFFSVSGFFLKILALIKKIYYKNLNMFVLKQISTKANETVLSTTIICLMLLLTIGILSSSISIAKAFNDSFSNNNMTDITILQNAYDSTLNDNSLKNINKMSGFDNYIKDYVFYYKYDTNDKISIKTFIDKDTQNKLYKEYGEQVQIDIALPFISLSDYNNILKLYNMNQISMGNNEYLLTANIDEISNYYKKTIESGKEISINNYKLTPALKKVTNITLNNGAGADNIGTIIIPDKVADSLEKGSLYFLGNYIKSNDYEKLEKDFEANIINHFDSAVSTTSKIVMEKSNLTLKAVMTFVGLYLGVIFAISSATILAIKELSEASDNKKRFLVLKQIGADNKMVNKALFTQVGIYFMIPLAVAIFHAFFGLKEINKSIKLLGALDVTSSIIYTSLFIILIYGGYFLATYLTSKSIIKSD